jgi:glycosyltransferase involved in cell wall biosynthesis
MPRISGTVITCNEEAHVEACIASLREVCDDVVVVDSFSSDRTVEIARSLGALVVEHEYQGEGHQHALADRRATHDWILALDADERMDEQMVSAIRRLPLDDPEVGYAFNRKSYVGSHWIDGPGFYPDHVTRLYNRTTSAYGPKMNHARVEAPRVERIEGHILHHTYDDISDWIAKIDRHTSLDARGLHEAGVSPSRWRPTLAALSALGRQLLLRGGLFRGIDGRTIAVTSAFRAYMKYLKLNELHESRGDGGSA